MKTIALKKVIDVEQKLKRANILSNKRLEATKDALCTLTESQDQLSITRIEALESMKSEQPTNFDKVTKAKGGGDLGLGWPNHATQLIFEMLTNGTPPEQSG